MKESPLLFNAPMVRALLDGSKTQTRRMFTDRMVKTMRLAAQAGEVSPFIDNGHMHENDPSYVLHFCPQGTAGDRIWVRETWRGIVEISAPHEPHKTGVARYIPDQKHCWRLEYAATQAPDGEPWRPSIHMPRWACRSRLDISGVRVQRLQDISAEDAIAEGMACITKDGKTYKYGIPDRDGFPGSDDDGWPWHEWERDPVAAFAKLWSKTYGASSWDANPWVWVIEFKATNMEGTP